MIDIPSALIGAFAASAAISVYMYVRIAAMRAEARQIRADSQAHIRSLIEITKELVQADLQHNTYHGRAVAAQQALYRAQREP